MTDLGLLPLRLAYLLQRFAVKLNQNYREHTSACSGGLLRREACFDGEGGSITVQTAVFTLLPRRLIPGNSEGYKARKGPGCREPRRKGMLGFVPIGMPLAQPTTVTMTPNNKAVKGYSGLPFPFTEMPRRNVLVYSVSGKYYSRKLGVARLPRPNLIIPSCGSRARSTTKESDDSNGSCVSPRKDLGSSTWRIARQNLASPERTRLSLLLPGRTLLPINLPTSGLKDWLASSC